MKTIKYNGAVYNKEAIASVNIKDLAKVRDVLAELLQETENLVGKAKSIVGQYKKFANDKFLEYGSQPEDQEEMAITLNLIKHVYLSELGGEIPKGRLPNCLKRLNKLISARISR